MNSQNPQRNQKRPISSNKKPGYRRVKRKNGGIIGLFIIVFLLIIGLVSVILCVNHSDNNTVTEVQPTQLTETAVPETTAEPVVETKTVSFAAVGDNIMYECNFTDAEDRANEQYPEYNFTPIYTDILPQLQAADLAFINQETLMAGAEYGYSGYPCFNSPQALGDQLCEMGFDIVGMANNHMLDMGSVGISDAIAFWKTKPVTMIGGYSDLTDYQTPRVVEKNGLKIAFLAYTYGTNGITLSESSPVIIPYIDDELITEDVKRAQAVSDCVVVSIHWGQENVFTPNDDQTHVAQLLCDLGVNVILGSHPHVIQPICELTGVGGNKTLCIYSLGDFVATMADEANMLGGVLSFNIVSDAKGIRVENVLFTPTVHHFGPSYYNSKLYYLSDYNDDLASILGNVYGINSSVASLTSIVKDVMDPQYLPDYLKS